MSRPASLPHAERYQELPCGTRAKYVAIHCRCARCRAANSAYVKSRDALAKVAALERGIRPVAQLAPQVWRAPDGTTQIRLYKRACRGSDGTGCPWRRHLRKDSTGDLCGDCRKRLVWNGLVPADAVKRHLRMLSRQGVGYKSVAIAADVSRTVLADVIAGKPQIRAETERRVLAVDREAIGAGTHVDARPTWMLIRRLLDEGFRKGEIARRLGRKKPALQIRRGQVTAQTAADVERLYHVLMEV
jgi:hypothetical protein